MEKEKKAKEPEIKSWLTEATDDLEEALEKIAKDCDVLLHAWIENDLSDREMLGGLKLIRNNIQDQIREARAICRESYFLSYSLEEYEAGRIDPITKEDIKSPPKKKNKE